MHALLKAVLDRATLIRVGDVNQLPFVGPIRCSPMSSHRTPCQWCG
jgi:hypothetical protein